ncbi:hypothetical protein ACM66B_006881 [Microbotryomycetes sp. NB124-2]
MAVRLRLSRLPFTRNRPQYHLVATNSSKRSTAKPLEVLGTFEPRPVVEAPFSVSPNGQRREEAEWGPRQIDILAQSTQSSIAGQAQGSAAAAARRRTTPQGAESKERQVLESVGAKQVEWNVERVKHWLNVGAVPTKPVEKLLNKAGLIQTSLYPRPDDKPVSRLTRINRAVRASKQPQTNA